MIEEGHLFRAMPQSATSRRRCGYTAPARTRFRHAVLLQPAILSLTHWTRLFLRCSRAYAKGMSPPLLATEHEALKHCLQSLLQECDMKGERGEKS